MMEDKSNLSGLPKGWAWATIEDVLQTLESGGRPRGGVRNIKEGVPSIGGEHLLYNGGFDFTNIRYIPREFYEKMAQGKIQKKDVLVVKDGATTGKTAFVADSFPFSKAAVNEHVFILRVLEGYTEPKYLFFWMQSLYGQGCIKENFKGTAQGGINSYFVKNSNFALPPLPEQHRIVAKIEELFTKLDAGVEALKKVKAQLKRYRQSVLKHAFEGKLTEEWRKAHKGEIEPASVLLERIKEERKKKAKGKYKELPPQDISDLPELPEGWAWTALGRISEIILGQSPPSSTYNEEGDGLPFYQGKLEFGNLYPTPQKWCTAPKKIAEKGDVLISVRAPVGPTNICPEKSCIGRGLAAVRSLGGIQTLFILYLMRSFEQNLANKGTGTTFKAITGDMLRKFPIPLAPILEEHRLVEEVERRLSVANEVEKVVEQSLKRAERLRQSILKRAFEGKLVSQDPSDEPAEKLLERIKAEGAKHEAERKKKRTPKRKESRKKRRRYR